MEYSERPEGRKEHTKARAELLAPAGSFESLKAAVAAGADAVYIGGSRFGARAYAENLSEDRMLEAIDYAHLHGVSLYLTVNTLVKEKELDGLYGFLAPYYERGLDAVIVQDLGVLAAVRRWFPDLHVHASTQMTITGAEGARLLKEMGATRVVTARELSLAELKTIHEKVDIEIESFVHGALCFCYSGQCLLSSLIGGRSGNRGRCAQPCRLPYDASGRGQAASGRNGQNRRDLPGRNLRNSPNERYLMSMKDLCTLDLLPDILESGVYSLKIEGRMKSPVYTAGVVSVYRKYLDLYLREGRNGYRVEDGDRKILTELFDRGGQTEGYYRKHNGKDMLALKEKPEFRQVNRVLIAYLEKTYIETEKKEAVCGRLTALEGEALRLRLWRAGAAPSDGTECGAAAEVTGAVAETAQNQPVTEERLRRQINKTGGTPFEFVSLDIRAGENLFVPVQALNELRREGLEKLKEAILRPYRRPAVKADETGNRPSEEGTVCPAQQPFEDGTDSTAGKCSGRTDAVTEQPSEDGAGLHAERGFDNVTEPAADRKPRKWRPRISVLVSNQEQLAAAVKEPDIAEIQLEADAVSASAWSSAVMQCRTAGKKCVLAMPAICRTEAESFFGERRKELCGAGFDGFLIRSLEEPGLLRRLYAESGDAKLPPLYADHHLYEFNHLAADTLLQMGFERLTCPLELNAHELKELLENARTSMRGRQGTESCAGQELTVYGWFPVMTTAQCIRRTVSGCDKKPGLLSLKDRTGKELPVYNHCAFCYNTIYNPAPLMLLGMEDTVGTLEPEVLRLQFLDESPRQLSDMVRAFADAYLREGASLTESGSPDVRQEMRMDFTRGHMKRGVE